LVLTAALVLFMTRFLLEHASLEGLVLNLAVRGRDPFPDLPVSKAVATGIGRSAVLFLAATATAMTVGLVLAVGQFVLRSPILRAIAWTVGTLGVSLPSFFWAMLLQLVVITWYQATGRSLLPTSGYGLDEHLVLPTLALVAQPTAYVFRTTAAALTEIAARDYVRTAHAKGLRERVVLARHIFPNARQTFLAGAGYASGSVLSSLAIVEYIFAFKGAGLGFIYAVASRNLELAVALAVAFSVMFALVTLIFRGLASNAGHRQSP
jgi:glutathione transport system permease protein